MSVTMQSKGKCDSMPSKGKSKGKSKGSTHHHFSKGLYLKSSASASAKRESAIKCDQDYKRKIITILAIMTMGKDAYKSGGIVNVKTMIPSLKIINEMYKKRNYDYKKIETEFAEFEKDIDDKGKYLSYKKNIEKSYKKMIDKSYDTLQGGGAKNRTKRIKRKHNKSRNN